MKKSNLRDLQWKWQFYNENEIPQWKWQFYKTKLSKDDSPKKGDQLSGLYTMSAVLTDLDINYYYYYETIRGKFKMVSQIDLGWLAECSQVTKLYLSISASSYFEQIKVTSWN